MKKVCCYLFLILTVVSFSSSALIKKEKYNPADKDIFVFDQYSAEAINLKKYSGLYSEPNARSLFYPSYKKYNGMEGYLDKEVKVGNKIYYKIVLKNGEVLYLNDLNSYNQIVSAKNYQKRLDEIEKLKEIKFPNIDDLYVTKVETDSKSKDIYIITFSNGLRLRNANLYGLLSLSKKITNPNDLHRFIDIINTDDINFTYNSQNNIIKIELKSEPLSIETFIFKEKLYTTTVTAIFSSKERLFIDHFKIFQNDDIYESSSDLTFKSKSGSTVYEWTKFILNNQFVSYINSLNDKDQVIVRFYGSRKNVERKIDPKTIAKIKKISILNNLLTKYFKSGIE
ncbi:hypothetical protein J3U21_01370 [Gilliamella sp. B2776]|uniref:hypothetical protein n=1 Tax=unclassified Gilliamella TaxID=2685620 RepID=UPI002269FB08|nr:MULTISPECIES: hypothetical protein [unclassified Gilliamella]MCX8648984.1 hypothetical protein [Gilliamella sp. B2779]MCX8653140.1 hypothetical protein [Gilliamella sp. B2737]MCX8655400.1 hypothetical protein [Gilliamella sp. B2894]MCX8664165.1 hypothetical protein [Gilliamella sp. B2887]MCX8690796.1 hypothetical protein [Gilliamella sp. B2776]